MVEEMKSETVGKKRGRSVKAAPSEPEVETVVCEKVEQIEFPEEVQMTDDFLLAIPSPNPNAPGYMMSLHRYQIVHDQQAIKELMQLDDAPYKIL